MDTDAASMPAITRPLQPPGISVATIHGIATSPISSRSARARCACGSDPSAWASVSSRSTRGSNTSSRPSSSSGLKRADSSASSRAISAAGASPAGEASGAARPKKSAKAAMPHAIGITARPRKRTLVSLKTLRPVAASRAEKARIAADCQTVMNATHSRTCQRMNAGPTPRSAKGSNPRPCRCSRTAPVMPDQPMRDRQAAVTISVPAASSTYWR